MLDLATCVGTKRATDDHAQRRMVVERAAQHVGEALGIYLDVRRTFNGGMSCIIRGTALVVFRCDVGKSPMGTGFTTLVGVYRNAADASRNERVILTERVGDEMHGKEWWGDSLTEAMRFCHTVLGWIVDIRRQAREVEDPGKDISGGRCAMLHMDGSYVWERQRRREQGVDFTHLWRREASSMVLVLSHPTHVMQRDVQEVMEDYHLDEMPHWIE